MEDDWSIMNLTFLGTGGGLPSPQRGVSAIALQYGRDILLFDCGEGTQRQFMSASLSFMKISSIFITHLHGDHVLGIPGLIQSMNLSGRTDPLSVFGPSGTVDLINSSLSLGYFNPDYEINVYEMNPGDSVNSSGLTIKAVEADHTVPAVSFIVQERQRAGKFSKSAAKELGIPEGPLYGRLQSGKSIVVNGRTIESSMVMGPPRRGRKLAYSGDTRPTDLFAEEAEGCDVMIHEATVMADLADRGLEFGHSSSAAAAEIAKKAGAKKLILTHFSNRYEDLEEIESEARKIFPDTTAAYDFYTFKVNFSE